MTRSLRYSIMIITSLSLIALIIPVAVSDASDSLTQANIYLYPEPHKVSDLVLKTPTGQTVSLNDYKGKVVLLHFWSITCPACKMEEPLLENLKRAYSGSGLEILGVNLVDPPSSIQRYAATTRTPFSILFDGGRGFSLRVVEMAGKRTSFLVNPKQEAILEVPGFPTTYIVDCRGSAVGYSVGPARWDDASAQAILQKLIVEGRTCVFKKNAASDGRYSMR
ncbi:MAG: TlpA disulfide reductase family protein [Desulfomonilaceae bacterium]